MEQKNTVVEDNAMDVFMDGPFMQWLRGFPEAPKRLSWQDLTNGVFLHNILQNFDAAFTDGKTIHQNPNSFHDRVTNMEALVRRLKAYYEDELGQTLVVKLPDTLSICHEPPVEKSLEEMEKLMLLILGAAVQCSHKEDLIGSIKNLPVESQHYFMTKIREVTDNPKLIWSSEYDDVSQTVMDESQRNDLYKLLVSHLKQLTKERDAFSHQIVEITLASPSATHQDTNGITPERNHLALEISEFKAKLRKLNQQLEEKTESLAECKEEMEKTQGKYAKLRQENLEVTQEARAARALRDELDIQRERANKVHLLETELQSYKDKMSQMESLKSRCEEMREENKILVETKDMLEEQLDSSRKRHAQIMSVENELYKYKAELHNCQLEIETDKKRIEELEEENLTLQMSSKSSISESQSILAEMETMRGNLSGKNDTNILTEQLGEGMSRIHKLELEIQKLRKENEDLKLNKFHADAEHALKLETENKKLSLTVTQLQKNTSKDAEANAKLQEEMRNLESTKEKLEQKVEALKEADEQYRIEKETIIDNLNKQVDSYKKRQERSNNEQIVTLGEENKKMVKQVTLYETKVNKLEREKENLQRKFCEVKEVADKVDDFSSEREKLKSELEALRKDNEELQLSKDSYAKDVEQLDGLNRKMMKLESEKSNYYSENLKMKQELSKLSNNLEFHKANTKKVQTLESERDEMLDSISKMEIKIQTLNATASKMEEQETELNSLRNESKKLQRSNTHLQRKVDEVVNQNNSLESENQKLEKTIENLRNESRSIDTLEKELNTSELNNHKLDMDNKSLTKQVERLKTNLEETEVTLEKSASKVKTLEREKLKLNRDLEQQNSQHSKFEMLETENRKLLQQQSDAQQANNSLREELVKEMMKKEELSESLEGLQKQLKGIGLDPNTLNADVAMLSNQRMQNLEGSLNKLLETRQKKIEALEKALNSVQEENCSLKQNIEVEKLKSGGDNQVIEAKLNTVVQERDEIRRDLNKVKMEMIGASEQLEMYKKKLEKVHANVVETEVANSTLQSQSTSLLGQINALQASTQRLESSKKKLEEAEKTWKHEREDLLKDQVGLQKLHDNLQADYEKLMEEKEVQKEVEKSLRNELKKLKSISMNLDEDQEKLMRAKEAIDMERESIRTDAKTLSNLRSEHARLKDDFRSLFTSNDRIKTEYCNLQSDYKSLKTTHNQLKLSQTELKGQLAETKDQLHMIDVEHAKTVNKIEVLTGVNSRLEEDRKNMMSHVTVLLSQYHELLTQTIDDKEHFHEEEKNFYEKMNNLSRQKEKLEEKIMDTYKNMNTPKAKKSGLGDHQWLAKSLKMMTKIGKKSSTSMNPSLPRPNIIHQHHLLHQHHHHDEHDSSSVGSGGNDSLGSGHHSPSSEMTRSESALELRGPRKNTLPTLSASQVQKSVFRKSMPMHLEDSDGNNADDDSVNSFISSSIHTNMDEIPTRDIGPERPSFTFSQSLSSHSELGLPSSSTPDNRTSRAISRVYLNGAPSSSSDPQQRSTTPQLTGWKSNNSSSSSPPMTNNATSNRNNSNQRDDKPPPAIPARKLSRAGVHGGPELPPQRPPKPLNGARRTSEDTRSSASGGSSPTLDGSIAASTSTIGNGQDPNSQNTAWYEYGCV